MAGNLIASAVAVPDAADEEWEQPSPTGASKRRISEPPGETNKRARLSVDAPSAAKWEGSQPWQSDQRRDPRVSGQAEERKRGQRLLGTLLGTLSQNSPTLAQKRRADVEKKQQAKLKLQAEEYDEKRKRQLEKLLAVRRREQRKFEEHSMRIANSNLLAMARFLKTTAEPKLYYKPWELRADEEDRINSQIGEAEEIINRNVREFGERHGQAEEEFEDHERKIHSTQSLHGQEGDDAIPDVSHGEHTQPGSSINNGPGTVKLRHAEKMTNGDTQGNDEPHGQLESARDSGEDAGDVVIEGGEDSVIY